MDPSPPDSRGTATSTRLYFAGAVVLLALNGYLTSLRSRPAIRDTGYLVGKVIGGAAFYAVLGLVVYGIARAFGKVKTRTGAAKVAFWVMATLFVLNCATLVAQVPSVSPASVDTVVTDAERQGLQLNAESIRHPILGFMLPHPGPGFSSNPLYQRQMDEAYAQTPGIVGWAFSDSIKREVLTIQVTKLQKLDEGAFRRFTHGIQEGFMRSKLVDESLTWKPGASEYRLTMLHQRGFYVKTRCIPRVEPGRSWIICVGTTAFDPNDLDSSRNGLKLIP